jgi:FkbM family methyltransferase
MQLKYTKMLLESALNTYKVEGFRSLVIETLRYLSLYETPNKVSKYWLHKLLGTEWVMRDVQGSKMLLNLKEGGINIDLYLNGIREPRATRYLQSILQPSWHVIDVGANIGYYALQEAKKCPLIIALEPDPKNYETLKLNISLNNSYNIRTYNVAAGDKEGEVYFNSDEVSNWRRVSSRGSTKVKVIRLDDWFCGKVDYLRMDTEGYELNILKGAEGIIKDSKPGMFIEVHNYLLRDYGSIPREFYSLLAEYDYTIEKSYVMAPTKEGPTGKVSGILKDREAWGVLVENSIASHIFIRK